MDKYNFILRLPELRVLRVQADTYNNAVREAIKKIGLICQIIPYDGFASDDEKKRLYCIGEIEKENLFIIYVKKDLGTKKTIVRKYAMILVPQDVKDEKQCNAIARQNLERIYRLPKDSGTLFITYKDEHRPRTHFQ